MSRAFSPKFLEDDVKKAVTIPFENYKEHIKNILDKWGFVVVTNILSPEECQEAEQLMYDDLLNTIDTSALQNAELSRLKQVETKIRTNEEHWPQASLPGLVGKGFLSKKGLPQGKFAWKLRLNKKCLEMYKHLHDDDDLVVGLDLPFLSTNISRYKSTNPWPHADQNINTKLGCDKSYQGILYVWDATSNDSANTVVWPRSWNTEYNSLLTASIPKWDKIKHGLYIENIPDFELKQRLMNDWHHKARRVQVPAGGIIIFNSRTIHQGFPVGNRLAQTLSWEPKKYRFNSALYNKISAIHQGIGTTHWASLGIHHGASFGKDRPPSYSHNHHKCIFPMKSIESIPVLKPLHNPKTCSSAALLESIKEESRFCL